MWSPNRLASEPTKANLDRICSLLRELYTHTEGNEYITLGTALQITTDPAGTPAANTLYKGLIPKAWVHYDQTGTPAILDDENIDSITDGGTGVQTHNLDRDFSGADNWCVVGMVTNDTGGTTNICPGYGGAPAAGSVLIHVRNSDGALSDRADCAYVFFGRQA